MLIRPNQLAQIQRIGSLACVNCRGQYNFRKLTFSTNLCRLPHQKPALQLKFSGQSHNAVFTRFSSNSVRGNPSLLRITPVSVVISALLSAGLYGLYLWLEEGKNLQKSEERIAALAESGLGTLDWSLTDQYGKRRQYSSLRGQWLMLYFGFCHCPDICPEELEKLTNVVSGIDDSPGTPSIQPIFITLDPERDTVQYMHKYCKDFSAKLIGFTGSPEEIAEVAKSYRVYFGMGQKDADGDYIVDHTICMYLINPDGQLVDVYERRVKVESIIKASLEHFSEYSKLKKKYDSVS